MPICDNCDNEIEWNADVRTPKGKFIPLKPGTTIPHDCPARKDRPSYSGQQQQQQAEQQQQQQPRDSDIVNTKILNERGIIPVSKQAEKMLQYYPDTASIAAAMVSLANSNVILAKSVEKMAKATYAQQQQQQQQPEEEPEEEEQQPEEGDQ